MCGPGEHDDTVHLRQTLARYNLMAIIKSWTFLNSRETGTETFHEYFSKFEMMLLSDEIKRENVCLKYILIEINLLNCYSQSSELLLWHIYLISSC